MKVKFSSIKTEWWIIGAIVTVSLIAVLIYIFHSVKAPDQSAAEKYLQHQLDSVVKVQRNNEVISSERDKRRSREIDSLHADNEEIKRQIKNSNDYHEKVITRYRSATAAELEKFFTDRYGN